jgi:hypothetical protein
MFNISYSLENGTDCYQIRETIEECRALAERLKQDKSVYMWSISEVIEASEAHWVKEGDL